MPSSKSKRPALQVTWIRDNKADGEARYRVQVFGKDARTFDIRISLKAKYQAKPSPEEKIEEWFKFNPVYGELLFRQATWHATLLHPFLYVIDSKRALSFGEAHLCICILSANASKTARANPTSANVFIWISWQRFFLLRLKSGRGTSASGLAPYRRRRQGLCVEERLFYKTVITNQNTKRPLMRRFRGDQ